MTGAGWRLLAAFLLILLAALLRGQNAADSVSILTLESSWSYAQSSALPSPQRGPLDRDPVGFDPLGPYRVKQDPVGWKDPIRVDPRFPHPILFPQVVQAAGIIFSGHVISVARHPASRGALSTTVTFKVEHAMRGTSVGEHLTIHEWAGLWSRGERYRVGEHVLLFLYSPSKLGLTSPVAGDVGKFAIKNNGEILLTPQHIHFLATDPILAGRTVAPYVDFSLAVQRAAREE